MTNGEKIKETFPNTIIIGCESYIQVMGEKYEFNNTYPLDWWNAEYQEPTTKNNLGVDCISRKAALDITWHDPSYSDPLNVLTEVRDKIRELPSVTPQPRKGHWIGHREHCENLGVMPSGLGCYEWCSNCDCGIDVREWHRNNYNFCPNCGADMREVEE